MSTVNSLPPLELKRRLDAGESFVLLDVREPVEIETARIEGSVPIPLGELGLRSGELDPDRPTVCICHHGIRSAIAAESLKRAGFRAVYNLTGGVDRWAIEVDPSMKRYR
jgi:rhodanese-related sulfurtransferase